MLWSTILRLLLSGVEWLKDRNVEMNTEKMVQQKTAQGKEIDRGTISRLIETAHYGKTQEVRDAAMREIQKREAIV